MKDTRNKGIHLLFEKLSDVFLLVELEVEEAAHREPQQEDEDDPADDSPGLGGGGRRHLEMRIREPAESSAWDRK